MALTRGAVAPVQRSIANALDNYAERRIAALCWKDPNIDTALIFRSATSSKYTLLSDIARVRWHWTGPSPPTAAEILRGVAEPGRLAAAVAALRTTFPEVAEVLRQAARPDGAA